MIHIKKFIDRVSATEAKPGRDLVMPIVEARALRDEISKLLLDKVMENSNKPAETVDVVVVGGKW
jgi:hypothetical protein